MDKKYRRILTLLTFVLVISSTIAYSALTASLQITAEAKLRTVADIRVTGISLSSSNGATLQYESNYDVNTISSGFKLPTTSSSITYKVTVTNNGTIDQTIYDIVTQSSNNSGLYYEISGYTVKDVIGFKSTIEFYITYKTTTPSNDPINVVTRFNYKKVYHVTFETNGGSAIPEQIKYEGVDLTLTSSEPTKTGYTFSGWTDVQNGTTVKYNKGGNYTLDRDLILYAIYNKETYNITYNLNGGTVSTANPTNYNFETNTFTLNNPTKTVKVTGNVNGTGATITNSPASKAQTFKGWSGTGLTGDTNKTVSITKGSTGPRSYTANWTPVSITLPKVEKNGYTCNWNTKANGTGTSYNSEGPYTPTATSDANITLYARCDTKITYNITYDLQGGTVSTANPTTYNVETDTFTLNNPTQTGYTFTGWAGSNGDTPQTSVTIAKGSTGDKAYIAHWTPNTYAITYDYNTTNYTFAQGKYIDTKYTIDWAKNFKLNQTINFPTLGSRYAFFGNYNSTNELNLELLSHKLRVYSNGEKGSSTGTLSNNTDIALEFNYNASNKSFTFTSTGTNSNTSVNGTNDKTGTGSTTLRVGTDSRTNNTFGPYTVKALSITDDYSYGTKLTRLPATPTKPGYTFVGWYDTSAATGGNVVTTNTNVPAANTTYYARWTVNDISLANKTLNTGTYGTAYTSNAFDAATNGTGSYTYTITSGAPTGATIDSANRTISFPATTTPGTYNVVVTATDNNTNKTDTGTMKIVINKRNITVTAGSSNRAYNGSALTNSTCSVTSGSLVSGHTLACTMTSGSTVTNVADSPVTNTISSYTIKNGTTDVASNYNVTTATGTLTLTKATCPVPTNVVISSTGVVTWTAASGASSYQISIDNSTFTAASSGVDYKNTIIAATGSRTVYVRSVCNTSNYSSANSANATASTTVYSVTLVAGTGIDSVSGRGNYITGATASINATASAGYTFSKWTQTTGGADVSTTKAYSAAITSNWSYTANATGNIYTVKYCQGNNSGTAGYTCSATTSSHTYGTAKNLTAYSSLGLTAPQGWTFAGWATTSESTSTTYGDQGSVINLTTTANGTVELYAVFTRNVTFKSGANAGTTDTTKGQYYNPYKTDKLTAVTAASSLTAISGWTALGYRGVNVTTAGAKDVTLGTNVTPAYNVSNPTYYGAYSRTINIYTGVNPSSATTTKPQYLNASGNTVGTISVDAPTAVNNWVVAGYRQDTNALTPTYAVTSQTDIKPAYSTSAVSLYGIYSRSITMAYNANCIGATGSTTSHNETQYYNSKGGVQTVTFTTSANGFSCPGRTFNKWGTTTAGGTLVGAGETTTFAPAQDATGTSLTKTMYAQWTANEYTITLNKNNATNSPSTEAKTTYGTTTITITKPTAGTYTKPVRTYSVKGFGLDTSRKSNGATVSSTADLTSTYTFDGWSTSSTGGNVVISNADTPAFVASTSGYTDASGNWTKAGGTTLYAKWSDGGVTLPTIIKAGYTCGWTESSTGTTVTYASGETIYPTAVKTLYGVCTPNKYTVTANSNGGSISSTTGWNGTGNTSTKSVTYDNAYGTLPTVSRNSYTFKGWSLLPEGYTQVEYIQSSGTQYIKTNIVPTNTMGTYLKLSSSNITSDLLYFGSKGSTNDRFWVGNSNNKFYFGWNNVSYGQNISEDVPFIVQMNFLNNRLLVQDSTIIKNNISNFAESNTYPIYIFAGNASGTANFKSSIRIYEFVISDESIITHKFIPCINNSTGKAGLYDLVTNTFYGNSGTGDFIAGNEKFITSETIVKETSNHNIYAHWTLNAPTTPTISGGTTKIYGSSATTLTCSSSTTYGTGINKYYSFGYATSDGGTPTNWTTPTTSATYSVPANAYAGQRWYSCRVYASDGTLTSTTSTSATTADTELKLKNAKLTFDKNTGTSGGGTVYTRTNETKVFNAELGSTEATLPTASKTGYTLDGWYTATTGGSKVLNANGSFTGTAVTNYTGTNKWAVTVDQTLYARWNGISYTIEYYQGTTKLGSSTHTYDVAKNLTAYSGTAPQGWTFSGWSTSDSSTSIIYTDGKSVSNLTSTNNGTVKLYAVFERDIVFHYGTNSATATDPVKQYYNPTATSNITSVTAPSPALPVASRGWSAIGYRADKTAGDKTYAVGAITPAYNVYDVDDNTSTTLNLYGVYQRTITLYHGKAKAVTATRTQYCNTVSNAVTVISAPAPSTTDLSGWSPLGYRANTTATNRSYAVTTADANITVTYNTVNTLYAVYSRTVTMAYNANGGTGTTASHNSTQYYNSNGGVSTVTFTTKANGFTYTGHTFSAWANDSATGTQVEAGGTTTFAPAVGATGTALTKTMYAIWDANKYDVSFNVNGGSGGQSATVEATYGSAMPTISTTAPTYTRTITGFGLDTSRKSNGATVTMPSGTTDTITSTKTFGGWYDTSASTGGTQYYTAAGASARTWNKTADTTLYARWSGGSVTLPKITKTGYTCGWTESSTGTTITYASEESITPTANKTLYGVCVANKYTVSFNVNGGSGTGYQTAKVTATYDQAMPTISTTKPTLTGYTFGGWYDTNASTGGTQYYTAAGASTRTFNKTSATTLYARWTINNPATPTISGGTTKIYGSSATILTCSTASTYEANTTLYYSFGYATSNGGAPANWTTASTSNTYSVPANAYVGQRWYSCRVYAKRTATPANTSSTITSATTADTELTINNATLTFNKNTGTLGGGTVYTKNGDTKVYSGIRNTTETTLPTASKIGYTLDGWYTAATGGSKVLNANGSFTGTAVSGYTSSDKWAATTDKTLYAHWTANEISLADKTLNTGTYGDAYTSNAFDQATNGTGSYTYTITSGAPSGATINSGARTISFPATTTPGTYNVVVTATDNDSSKTDTGTMKIVINKRNITVTAGSTSRAWNNSALTNTTCTAGSGQLVSGHTVTCTMTSASTITTAGSVDNEINTVTIKSGTTDVTSNYNITKAKGTLAITLATPTLSLTAKSAAYTGSAIAANTVSATPDAGGNKSYTYYSSTDCSGTALSGAPTNVGNYSVKATVAAVSNKTNANSICKTHTIIQSTTTTTMSAVTKTYNGSAQAASGASAKLSNNTTISGAAFTYTYYNGDSCSGTALSGAPTNAGTYSVKATLTGTTNYKTSTSSCVKYTMNKKDVTLTAGSTSRAWNGKALTNSTCTAGSGQLVSGHTVTCTMTSASTITTAGSVDNEINTVTIKSGTTDVTSNYNITKAKGTLTITLATPTLSLTAKSAAYTGSAIAANAATVSPNSSPSITYTYYTDSSCTTKTGTTLATGLAASSGAAPVVAGQYYVKASAAAVTNKTAAANSSCTSHKITTKAITVTAGTSSRAWNGSALTNSTCSVTTGSLGSGDSAPTCTMTSGSTITVASTTANTSASVNNTINTVTIKKGTTDVTASYNITKAAGKLTISYATPTVSLTAKSATYTGSAIAANAATASPDASGAKTYTYYTDSSCSTTTGTTLATGLAASAGAAPKAPGTWYVKAKVAGVSTKTNDAYSACTTHTITKATCPAPTNVAISTAGVVTWTAASGASSYQISMTSNSGFTAASSGVDYKSSITAATGSRTVYVRSVCDTNYYTAANSSNASKGTTVFAVSLTKGTGIDSVSGAGNYITGATASISASVSAGYTWTNWTGTSTLTANSNSITVNAAKSYTANATANTYTVKYCQGNNSTTAGYTCSTTTSSHTYGTAKNLTTYASSGLTAPQGWTFYGWSTSSTATSRTYTDGQSVINLTTTANGTVELYAVFSRTVKFNHGASAGTTSSATQYYNPYQSSTTYVTNVSAPAPTLPVASKGWSAIGYRADKTAADKTYAVTTAAANIKPASNVYDVTTATSTTLNLYAVYSRTVTLYHGKEKASGAVTRTQYCNTSGNTVSAISAPAPQTTDLSGWSARGYRADTTAADRSYAVTTAAANISPAYNVANTLYAVYTRNLTMAYNANCTGYSGTTASHTLAQYYNTNDSVSTVTFTTSANGFTCPGRTFNGWGTTAAGGTIVAAGGTTTFAPVVTSTGTALTKTMYAQWTGNTYTITLNKNGATNTPTSSMTATYGTTNLAYTGTYTKPVKSYTVSGFTTNPDSTYDETRHSNGSTVSSTADITSTAKFNGWYTSSSDGTKVISSADTPSLQVSVSGYTDSSGNWSKDDNVTLYAQFDTQPAVKLPTITKQGYTCGWTTSSTGTTITHASGATITPTSDLTLYGVCVQKKYTLVIDKRGGTYNGSTAPLTYENVAYNSPEFLKIITNRGTQGTPSKAGYDFSNWYYFQNAIQKPRDVSTDVNFSSGTAGLTRYDNNSTNSITISRISNGSYGSGSSSANPVGDWVMAISKSSAASTTPGMGGFYQIHSSAANKTYVHVFLASVGRGNYLQIANNGTATKEWLTPNEGTGGWQVYAYKIAFTSNPGTFGYIYYSTSPNGVGTAATAFSSKLGYSAVLDVTSDSSTSSPYGTPYLNGSGVIAAAFVPKINTITLSSSSSGVTVTNAGTTKIYERFDDGYYKVYSSSSGLSNKLTSTSGNAIVVPTSSTHNFQGYYTGTNGTGTKIIGSNGKATANANTGNQFPNNGTLYASWTKKAQTTYSCRRRTVSYICSQQSCTPGYFFWSYASQCGQLPGYSYDGSGGPSGGYCTCTNPTCTAYNTSYGSWSGYTTYSSYPYTAGYEYQCTTT